MPRRYPSSSSSSRRRRQPVVSQRKPSVWDRIAARMKSVSTSVSRSKSKLSSSARREARRKAFKYPSFSQLRGDIQKTVWTRISGYTMAKAVLLLGLVIKFASSNPEFMKLVRYALGKTVARPYVPQGIMQNFWYEFGATDKKLANMAIRAMMVTGVVGIALTAAAIYGLVEVVKRYREPFHEYRRSWNIKYKSELFIEEKLIPLVQNSEMASNEKKETIYYLEHIKPYTTIHASEQKLLDTLLEKRASLTSPQEKYDNMQYMFEIIQALYLLQNTLFTRKRSTELKQQFQNYKENMIEFNEFVKKLKNEANRIPPEEKKTAEPQT